MFNGDQTWTAGTHGTVTNDLPCVALYDTPDLTLTNRVAVGTSAGNWGLSRGFEGFLAIGPTLADDTLCVVLPNNVCRNPVTGHYYYGDLGECSCCHCCGCDRFKGFYYVGAPATDRCPANIPDQIEVTVSFPCIGTRTLTLDRDGFDFDFGCHNSGDAAVHISYSGSYLNTGSGSHPYTVDYCDDFPVVANGPDFEQLTITLSCINCPTGLKINNCTTCVQHEIDLGSGLGSLGIQCDCGQCPTDATRSPCPPSTRASNWRAVVDWAKVPGVSTPVGEVHYDGLVTLVSCEPLSFTKTATAACRDVATDCPTPDCNHSCCSTYLSPCNGGTFQFDGDEV